MNKNHISIIKELKKHAASQGGMRILSQLEFAVKLSKVNEGRFDKQIAFVANYLMQQIKQDGVITDKAAAAAELDLQELAAYAKKYTMICAAHAHIDMNWMWDYSETVAITLETFRTMLNLMEEYPEFTFSQSQASVYKIVEKHDPAMLAEIKKRVAEGRWEVTASTWVEADKNMPNGESHARHLLYTRKYLMDLLDLSPESFEIDYEPDTFGHSLNIPEILSKGGVKYYYQCRGYEGHHIYKWKAPSGASVIVFREPLWYNMDIAPAVALHVPEFCEENGLDSILYVYGVGDHGGGPTRRDLEKLIDMNTWPVYPNIKFGTYIEFFKELEKISDRLPIVEGELNFVFTGCYTTQTRIKTANRIGEAKLDEAESVCALAANFLAESYPAPDFDGSWRKLLFNQFHDILPGSGVVDTREYAMGEFQKILAYANTGMTLAYRNIAMKINTASLLPDGEALDAERSEGGGAGFGLAGFGIPHAERGRGINRIFHVFNPTQYERNEIVELTAWDWEGDIGRIGFVDSKGGQVRHQLYDDVRKQYWGHEYIRILLEASVPPYGYSTYLMTEAEAGDVNVIWPPWPRLETSDELILENDRLRAVFNESMGLVSLVEKENGTELVDGKRRPGGFRFIVEDDTKGMTAWVVGRYMQSEFLSDNVRIKEVRTDGDGLRKWLRYEQDFRNSKMKVMVSLDSTAARLDFEVECDWQEKGIAGKGIPQLAYRVPVNYKCLKYKYDVPFGTIKRDPLNHDVPANSWMAAIPQYGNKSLALVSNSRYGFRGYDDSMSLSLIRSSYDPDPYPDNGICNFRFSLGPVVNTSRREYIKYAYTFNHPSNYIPGTIHGGDMQLDGSFLELEKGSVVVSSLKKAEDCMNGIMLRVYETEGLGTKAGIRFMKEPTKAYFTDIHEKETDGLVFVNKNRIEFSVGAFEVKTLIVEFK